MMLSKTTIPLGELSNITVGYVGPMADEYVENGVPFLRSLNVRPFRYSDSNLKHISREFHDKIKKSKLSPGDVVVVRTGVPGSSCVIPDSLTEANCSDLVIIRCGDNLDPHFISYYINSIVKSQINSKLVGAIQKHFNIGSAKKLPIPHIDLISQQQIGCVLSTIDSKIDLNNRINTELESLARTIYDYWFLQFDFPDAEGRPYRSSGGAMRFDEETSWSIPEGWTIKSLSDIANITMGQSPPGTSLNSEQNGTVFYQGCTDFTNRFPFNRLFTTEPKRMANEGDIFLSVRAPVGRLNIANENCCIGRGLAALSSKSNHDNFLYYVLTHLESVFDRRNSNGTTFGSITKSDLYSLKVIVPPLNLLDKFNAIAGPGARMINNGAYENAELSALRDWLLPLLMSGEVRVGE